MDDNTKIIIDLFGIGNIGKTSVLIELINLFQKSNVFKLIKEISVKSRKDKAIICNCQNNIIGIITEGDPGCEEDVDLFLSECLNNKCNIIYAASRNYGGVYNRLRRFANANDYSYIETSPLFERLRSDSSLDYSILHTNFAKMLFALIDINN